MTELAGDCKMSQSNVYRFFPKKADLVAALVLRWFAEIETELSEKLAADRTWQDKLKTFVRVQLDLKSARFDADPELFRAYLTLAEEHPEPVAVHVGKLQGELDDILGAVFEAGDRAKARCLVEDATRMFRDPYAIARLREACRRDRADAVIGAVIRELESWLGASTPQNR